MGSVSAMPKLDLSARLARLLPFSAPGRAAPHSHSGQEQDLILRLRRADPAAVDELYRMHHAMLRAFAQRLVGDEAAAEDLVHDVFVQLPGLMRKFRGQSSLRSFLVGVAANLGSRHVRAASRRRAAMSRFALEAEISSSGQQVQAARETLQKLYRALDALSHDHRTAFVLCEIEERSCLEVAELLGVPEATVRTRCFHARRKLSKALEQLAQRARP